MIIIRPVPRRRSEKVHALKAKLLARITDGFHSAGQRFLSARAVATRYGVSYQTADVIIRELEKEGHLRRRRSAGTFIAGRPARLRGVQLCFHARARQPGSFGANLAAQLQASFRAAGIASSLLWPDGPERPAPDLYPVFWEVPSLMRQLVGEGRYVLLLNDRPKPGMEASMVDALATDDYSAGVCAAQVLRNVTPKGRRYVVVGGPAGDRRSQQRILGFQSHIPQAGLVSAGGWYFEDGVRVALAAVREGASGIFCVNDRLAQGVIAGARRAGCPLPPIVGHDNAPVAELLHLTTIALPWEDLVRAAVDIALSRLSGDALPARQIILAQRPVYRLTA